jgi:hypothetical protein
VETENCILEAFSNSPPVVAVLCLSLIAEAAARPAIKIGAKRMLKDWGW